MVVQLQILQEVASSFRTMNLRWPRASPKAKSFPSAVSARPGTGHQNRGSRHGMCCSGCHQRKPSM